MPKTSDILEQDIFDKSSELLDCLLIDRTKTTARKVHNIIWANDNYENLGKGYSATAEMTSEAVRAQNSRLIRPRALKEKDLQKKRTKEHAEVFTPSWIVDKQVSACEESCKKLPLRDYVSKLWMEITSGEAPYIANRYEMDTGELIAIPKRVGFLDRKLRRINSEVDSKEEWNVLVRLAYKSTYGFEWSGDSLLLARENILYTFVDYYEDKWESSPSVDEMLEVAEIISYNIFQMDGLKLQIPLSEKETVKSEEYEDIDIFGNVTIKTKQVKTKKPGKPAKIMDWKSGKMIEFARVGR